MDLTGYIASGPPLTTNGFLLGPNFGFPQVAGGSGNLATADNQVRVVKFYLEKQIRITKVGIQVSGGLNGTHFSVGIYDSNGNKVIDSGVFTVAGTGNQSVTISAVTLQPGLYFFAQTADSVVNAQLKSVSLGDALLAGLLNLFTTVYGNGANPSAGGVLPATLGTVTAENGNAIAVAMAVFG